MKKSKEEQKKKFIAKITITLIILFILAFLLRFYFLPQNLFFGPEQGIDFLVIKNIVINHKFTLIGAKTDVSGIFHGPIYYYLSTIPFLLSHGSPLFILGFFILLNCTTVFFAYILGKKLFNTRVGLLSAIFFTVSFEAIVYSRWLSSHPLSLILSALFFYFIYRFLHNDTKSLFFVAITYGLLGQSEFLNFLFFAAILVVIFALNFSIVKKQKWYHLIFAFLVTGAISAGNFLLFDLRHQFLITKSVFSLLSGKSGYHTDFATAATNALQIFISTFSSSITPFSSLLAIIVLCFGLFLLGKQSIKNQKNAQLILIWLLVPTITLILLKHQVLEQFFVCSVLAMIIMVAIILDKLWSFSKIIGITLTIGIVGLNLYTWTTNIQKNQHTFFQSTQPDLKYSDEKKVIDKVYAEAKGKPFSFQSYTIPYWSQQGWEYLFWQYGQQKYGYYPIPEKARTLFVIVQDDPSYRSYQNNWLKNTVPTWGTEIKSFHYGILTIKELKVTKL